MQDSLINTEFCLDQNLIYLNHAAVSPWPKRTVDAVKAFADQNGLLGSYHYLEWLKKQSLLRQQFQQLLNAPSADDIALVKNTSEAISFVAYGLDWQNGDNIVSSNQEFPSNRLAWQSLHNLGVEFREANLKDQQPEQALFDLIDHNTRLVSISSVQFADGLKMDLEQIGAYCKQRDILFCIDAIQSLGALDFDVQAYHADFVMADGHKWLLGPEGLGVFYCNADVRDRLKLTQYGWHMMKDTHNYENKAWEIHPGARRFECGSPNMLTIQALSASVSLLLELGMKKVESQVLDRTQHLVERISRSKSLSLLSDSAPERMSGITLFQHHHCDNQTLYKRLLDEKIICAQRGGGIRFSPHIYNSVTELDQAIAFAEQ